MPAGRRRPERGDNYKWVALANTTFGVIMATIDSSIMLIALPDIFKGINIDPLKPGNSFYLLWMILSFLVVSSVLVVSLGRLGDMFGRVKMYNLGFAIYTLTSLVLTVDWLTGPAGAMYLVVGRVFQGVGAAFLVANSSAILTDAFPENQRGMALGHQQRGRDQRLVRRPGPGRDPGADRLAPDLPGLGALRAGRHAVGLLQAAGHLAPAPGAPSTGPATSPSPSGWSWSWSASPTGSSPTAATPWAGPARRAG